MNQPSLFSSPRWTVTSLTAYLREIFESDEMLRDVWIQGEISNLSRPRSGHIYFTLKDGGAALRSVMWRSSTARLALDLREGMAVEAHGYLGIYDVSGQYQLYADEIRPVGEGLLYQEFLRLKEMLEAEGLFDDDRKRVIPELPKKIGIITSATGAALRDMLNTLQRRMPLAEVILAPTTVQGDTAPPKIIAALDDLLRIVPDLDVILLGRGGGSIEDLWAFNDERVVRAVAASPVPIISGVGHETDFTLTDFASDLRAATPTAAAELATPITIDELRGATSYYADQLKIQISNALDKYHINVDDLCVRLGYASPLKQIQRDAQSLDGLLYRLNTRQTHRQDLMWTRIKGMNRRLEALNPQAVLGRGYAVLTRQTDQKIVGSVDDANAGDELKVRVADGEFGVKVT
ncbi:MAG: exodeoxyribonuclease VII large subunit [Anaerolineales bacterium]|uniref:Exodeoxyribonuclease 7 large subunit n=1 Tax=Candidatus Desulfolinea nitratireducens TaxID=2841698 RepID=A0A8J6NIV6_9CHLR|nr:exodeoxyribonuclease VII large subunit [Candidatus Desulfolinea nitratireducens]MBL6959865.1 exodeoxyribonuclease VII large subunit [Anaerolineales bacterium]